MRRLPCLPAVAIALLCLPASAGAQIVFDDGYDPDSPAGKQYSIPAEKVVEETSGGRARRSGTKAQGGAGPLFGAGVTQAGSGSSTGGSDDGDGGTAAGAAGSGSNGGGNGEGSSGGKGADGASSADSGGVGAREAASGMTAGERAAEQTRVLAERTAGAARAQAEGAASGTDPGLWLLLGLAAAGLLGGALTLLARVGRGSTPPPATS